MEIDEKNLHSVQINYYMDTKRFIRGADYFMSKQDYQQAYYHLISYIENRLAIGQISDILEYKFTEQNPLAKIIAKQKGFYPLDQALKRGGSKQLKKRHLDYLKSVENNTYRKIKPFKIEIIKLNGEELGLNINSRKLNLWQIKNNPISEPKYYFDRGHYNTEGTEKYTRLISNIVKKRQKGK